MFPDIEDDDFRKGNPVRVEASFRGGVPGDEHVCNGIGLRCWRGECGSVEEVVRDLEKVERG